MEPFKQISSNRINKIDVAFLFQGTNPPFRPIISLLCCVDTDAKGYLQLN